MRASRRTPAAERLPRQGSPQPVADPARRSRALLVGVDWRDHGGVDAEESIEELGRLARTAGIAVVGKALQATKRPHPATFIGAGKVDEIRSLAGEIGADIVLFDHPLSPAQQRNLAKALCLPVIDRSQLILDIFARRAKSMAGKLQVELAQLEYLLPRLTRQWLHLSRLGGGVGTRGPGETQLEVDRRRVRERIAVLRKRLDDVARTRGLHRRSRADVPYPTIALVGYTNAGKSTLMNRLTDAGTFVEDQLFATLDPTVRRLDLPNAGPVLLVDTVGFINKLPHGFVDAFKSTLEEVSAADLLLHVIDASNPHAEQQAVIVDRVLDELGCAATPQVTVLNKVDQAAADGGIAHLVRDAHAVSALHGDGIDALLQAIDAALQSCRERMHVRVPSARGDLLARLYAAGSVVERRDVDGVVEITALVPVKVAGQVRKALAEGEPRLPC